MLQPAGDAYRVHDLVLRFLKPKLKADLKRSTATSRMGNHLGQLKVLQRFVYATGTRYGVYSLISLWRSVEDLSGESQAGAIYSKSLHGVMEDAPWFEAGCVLELMVSVLSILRSRPMLFYMTRWCSVVRSSSRRRIERMYISDCSSVAHQNLSHVYCVPGWVQFSSLDRLSSSDTRLRTTQSALRGVCQPIMTVSTGTV